MNFSAAIITGTHVCITGILPQWEVTLAQRYEQAMARIEHITNAGYQVEMQWECEFDKDILPLHLELKTHSLIQQIPPNTRDALYGVEPRP
jgi:G:T-mismatch repair DNA endonuclease (very short patch repair protein)